MMLTAIVLPWAKHELNVQNTVIGCCPAIHSAAFQQVSHSVKEKGLQLINAGNGILKVLGILPSDVFFTSLWTRQRLHGLTEHVSKQLPTLLAAVRLGNNFGRLDRTWTVDDAFHRTSHRARNQNVKADRRRGRGRPALTKRKHHPAAISLLLCVCFVHRQCIGQWRPGEVPSFLERMPPCG